MSVDVSAFTAADATEWNRYVEQSPQTTPFHRYEALDLLADAAGADLHTLVGFKGQEPTGVLPLFEQTRGPFRLVTSPPEMEVLSLGPALLNADKLKQRKAERRHRQFVDGCLDWIDGRLAPDYVDIRTVDRYGDVRPFIWNGYDVTPAYTYVVDLTPDEEDLLMSFSSDARSNIRDSEASSASVTEGGPDDLRQVVASVRERHAEQGESYPITAPFVEALYDLLPEDRMRVYTVRADGERGGGMVTLEDGDTVYRWMGGAKTGDRFPPSDFLDWRILTDAKARGIDRFDLLGANTPRLCRYKAKFDPDPSQYYVAKRQTATMRTAVAAYQQLPDSFRVF
jgi:CelD/BcsL family acetyltransferase involved in cellulose biosynthesis